MRIISVHLSVAKKNSFFFQNVSKYLDEFNEIQNIWMRIEKKKNLVFHWIEMKLAWNEICSAKNFDFEEMPSFVERECARKLVGN